VSSVEPDVHLADLLSDAHLSGWLCQLRGQGWGHPVAVVSWAPAHLLIADPLLQGSFDLRCQRFLPLFFCWVKNPCL